MLWIVITIAAAALQTARNAFQRRLTGRLTALGATYTRFVFGLPFALAYAAAVFVSAGGYPATPHTEFLVYACLGGIAQMGATLALITLFQLRNFSAGIAFSKIEILLAALMGFIILGDRATPLALTAIALATLALLLLSKETPGGGFRALILALTGRAALLGLATGAGFAIAAVSFRAASLSLEGLTYLQSAAETLAVTLFIQTIMMTLYLRWQEPGQISLVFRAWRPSLLPGLSGAGASAGWFTAMTLEQAAYVRMLGLIEVPMSIAVSIYAFKERASSRELAGTALLLVSIVVLLAGASS